MRRVLIGLAVAALISATGLAGESAQDGAWWKEQKIRFMWGCWGLAGADKAGRWEGRDVPREVFRNVALSGATVYGDTWYYKASHARLAKEFGMRVFAPAHLHHMTWLPASRRWINEEGKEVGKNPESTGREMLRCPLDAVLYERWLVGDVKMAGIREGIIDGIHVDWESTEAGICYCDDCFSTFLEIKGIEAALPEKAKRFPWLKERDLVVAYEDSFHDRRVAMFRGIREKLQAVNPRFLFSSYNVLQPQLSDFLEAMHTPETPFLVLDAKHYQNDDRQPWWESYSARLKRDGYLYIAGGWSNALFGAQPSQVSAAQWIYETSINEDGVWMWFEHELTEDNLRAYAAADRKIRAVQRRVGKYLFHGRRDLNFVTAVEWTGRPELEKAVISRTYHLGEEHLAHVNNVHTEWPLRVRLQFPRLAKGDRWTVRDPMGDLTYTQDGKSAVWTSADLLAGVVVAMEPRSDLFLLISPADKEAHVDPSALIYSREIADLPEHAAASEQAAPVEGKVFSLPAGGWSFRMDEEDIGVEAEWFLPTAALEGWAPIEIEGFWGDKGGTGAGWYRRDVTIPALPEGKEVYLHFGAVDEELMLWIDGRHAGDHNTGPDGWDKPFAMDVTGKLTAGKHHIAMRVYNSKAAGGVWKPVSVLAGPAAAGAGKAAIVRSAAPATGRLVYTATEEMGFEGFSGVHTIASNAIRTMDGDGANQLRVRQLRGRLWSPTYSPDGGRIAFVHDTRGRGQIFVINEDGTDAANVSNNAYCDRSPRWSPDGGKIAFVSNREGDWDIYVMNADGGAQRRLAGHAGLDRAPAWSPDGRRIAWESHVSGMPNIWVCDVEGGDARALINPEEPLRFQSVFQGKEGVFVLREDAGSRPVFADNTMYLWDPVWSPDGTRIATGALHSAAGETVALLQADGSRLVQLIYGTVGVGNVTWSPDGTQLAGTLRTAPQETERSGIFVVNADGTDKYRWLVDVTPQGPRLGGATRGGMVTWYSHGSAQPRRVLKTFTSLAWSPDGKTLAFSSDMDPTGAFHVYTINPEGGKPRCINQTKSAWPNEICWR